MKMYPVIIFSLLIATGCDKGGGGNTTSSTPPKMSINDVSLPEGNAGITNFEFTISLDKTVSNVVNVKVNTTEGSAKAGEDFTAVVDQSISFQPGEKEKKIIVSVVADEYKEGEDEFEIVLSNISNATLQKSKGTGFIKNDDTKVFFTNAGFDAPTSYAGYSLLWSDEFNGSSLDQALWSNQNGDGCPNLCGWGNNELEYYTDRPQNIFFQEGKLIIEAKKENYGGKPYTSSKILTAGKKAFKFGRIDIRAKLPKGKGIWPAFWLLPQDNVFGGWPRSGEIDLMEMVGHEPNKVYGTLHFGPGPGSTQISRGYTLPGAATFNDEFHVFSVEWKLDQIKWFVDGNLFSTVNKSDLGAVTYPFNEQFYLIFNLAVGGNWPGNPDASTYFPQWLIVDYIRVYQ